MPSSNSASLVILPTDIQKLIIAALRPPSYLFIPTYEIEKTNAFTYGDLARKQSEYYPPLNTDDIEASQALLNWSATCKFYRDLLAPVIFETVVLRAKPKSISSCNALITTDHWKHVKTMLFCGTYVTEERDNSDPKIRIRTDPLENLDFNQLASVLSQLPPNLQTLKLDFPTSWIAECEDHANTYLDVFHIDEKPEQTLVLETDDRWRKMLFTVFNAVVKNDISSAQDFKLFLLNVPPLPCSVYWSSEFHQFLSHIYHLEMAFSHFDNGAGWRLNTMDMPAHFASNLASWFWNHLINLTTLVLQADESCPVGLAPGRCHIPLSLPEPSFRFQKLDSLTLKWWLIDFELITLLTKHMPSLRNLTMINYYADDKDNSSSEAEKTPSFSNFFAALRRHPALNNLTFMHYRSGHQLLDPFNEATAEGLEDAEDPWKAAYMEVGSLEAARSSTNETGMWTAREDARMKRVWPHGSLDGKYGDVYNDEGYNAERFVDGSDHEAWLRLCDMIEQRGGACKVVDIAEET